MKKDFVKTDITITTINEDNADIVAIIAKEMELPPHKALSIIIELGLLHFLTQGTTPEKKRQTQLDIDQAFCENPKLYQAAMRLQAVWNIN